MNFQEAPQDKVVTDLIRGISEDKASREGWEQQIQSAIQNLGCRETVDKSPRAGNRHLIPL
ncbi:hypothetical protein Bealeia2_02032 (plasmid) [Candidatus Bealeia paramacronuclearis]|nr:hypothetical protein [Candidatus Bealeia paramacronuclearis]